MKGEVRYAGLYKFPAYRAAFPMKKKLLENYSYLDEAKKINQEFLKMDEINKPPENNR